MLNRSGVAIGVLLIVLGFVTLHRSDGAAEPSVAPETPPWSRIRAVAMGGGFRLFWNVRTGARDHNNAEAARHGFESVDLLNTYGEVRGEEPESPYLHLDFPGREKNARLRDVAVNRANPWDRPASFEPTIRRNLQTVGGAAIFVNDIEFRIERDADAAWRDPVVRRTSRETTRGGFRQAYFRKWAEWLALPCAWAKEAHPGEPIGLYGAQPFRVDWWGIYGRSAEEMNALHAGDAELWRWIEPAVDFYTASVYLPYDNPDSLYFIASNVEENYARALHRDAKPLYAYVWLRYHSADGRLAGHELRPYQAEAAAVLPYFCGARGVVLWGAEPDSTEQPYTTLPVFMDSIARVAELAPKMRGAKLVADEPARAAWNARRPLVRKLEVSDSEWIVLAADPWQADDATTVVNVACGERTWPLEVRGRHSEVYHVDGDHVERLPVPTYPPDPRA